MNFELEEVVAEKKGDICGVSAENIKASRSERISHKQWLEEKPTLKAGEILCGGCWAIGQIKSAGWLYMTFKYLTAVYLCPNCRVKDGSRLELMQRQGL